MTTKYATDTTIPKSPLSFDNFWCGVGEGAMEDGSYRTILAVLYLTKIGPHKKPFSPLQLKASLGFINEISAMISCPEDGESSDDAVVNAFFLYVRRLFQNIVESGQRPPSAIFGKICHDMSW